MPTAGASPHPRSGRWRTRLHTGHGPPASTPERQRPRFTAHQAYSSRAIREHLRRRGARTAIPQPSDQIANRKRRGSAGGRPPAFDRDAYKQRNTVERCINRLKQWLGLVIRYDKTATVYLAAHHIAGIFIWSTR
ncbi:transposase [Streptomyces toyocaensis]|uniref:transposase n=1 Tax=Streptomyces toyocaensis TaxID=55952 RepID=UPI00099D64BA